MQHGRTVRGRGEDAAAAERARLVARDAGVEVGRRLGAALGVLDLCRTGHSASEATDATKEWTRWKRAVSGAHLLLRREGHVEEQLRRHDPVTDGTTMSVQSRTHMHSAWARVQNVQHVWRDIVARHARLGLLDALVEAEPVAHNTIVRDMGVW